MSVPVSVRRVRDAAGAGATGAQAPGSVELLGEACSATGGMLLATALSETAAVAIEPIEGDELVIANSLAHRLQKSRASAGSL